MPHPPPNIITLPPAFPPPPTMPHPAFSVITPLQALPPSSGDASATTTTITTTTTTTTAPPPHRRSARPTGEARRRTGCWPCKRAHSRCQEQRPACARCRRLGLACAYGIRLLWKEDAIQRGICLGREGVWTRAGGTARGKGSSGGDGDDGGVGERQQQQQQQQQQVFLDTGGRRPIFLNTTYAHLRGDAGFFDDDDYEEEEEEEEGEEGEEGEGQEEEERGERDGNAPWGEGGARYEHELAADQFSKSLLDHRIGSGRDLPYKEAYLLDYFTSFICPNCSLSPTHNPYLRYITPMALSYAPLHCAIVSVAANQLRLLNDHRYAREAWLYKDRAIQGLRTSIAAGGADVAWPFVATVLMLCFYDISDGCDDSWMTHLKGGLSVLEHVRKTTSSSAAQSTTEAASLARFFVMYFVAHQIMGLTAKSTEAGSSSHGRPPSQQQQQQRWLEDDCMEEIDALMGCSRGLLSLIDRTSEAAAHFAALLSRHNHYHRAAALLTPREQEDVRAAWQDLAAEIRTVPQTPPPAAMNKDNLVRVAECKRTTALLYLHERLAPFLPAVAAAAAAAAAEMTTTTTTTSFSSSVTPPPASSFPFPSKADLVATLVAQLSALPATPTLLWPLFVLGRAANPANEDHRRFVLDRLADMQRLRNLGSVRLARRLVEGEYRRWDLGLQQQQVEDGYEPPPPPTPTPLLRKRREVGVRGKWVSLA